MQVFNATDNELLEELERKRVEQERIDAWRLYDGKDKVVKIKDYIEELSTTPQQIKIHSGIKGLDKLLDGFQRGEVVVVTGQTGQGKTTFLQSLTFGFEDNGINTLWFSYEVGAQDLAVRFGKDIPNFSLPKITVAQNIQWLEQKIYEGIAKHDTRVVFIDHLHYLLNMKEVGNGNSSLVIGHIMRSLKEIAIRTNTTIFLVSHLKMTKLEDVPDLDDLRDSSFVAQEADIVIVIWRLMRDKPDARGLDTYTTQMGIKVAKNRRKGTLGYIVSDFDGVKLKEVKNV